MRAFLHTLRLVLRERLRPARRVSPAEREAWEREREELPGYRGHSVRRRRRTR